MATTSHARSFFLGLERGYAFHVAGLDAAMVEHVKQLKSGALRERSY